MNRFVLVMFLSVVFCSCRQNAEKVADTLKVMSYNIRYDNPGDGENIWDIRKPATKAMIYDLRPDVFGVQEAQVHQIRYIEENCPHYASVGVGRDDGKEAGEFMSIFYDKEKIKLLEWGTFWLSRTPEKPSRGWDAACFRTATWAKMEILASGRQFFFYNTHLDHIGRNARKNGLELIVRTMKEKNTEGLPTVLTGDFNVTPDNIFALDSVYAYLNNAAVTAAEADSLATNNAFGKRDGKVIDYIWWKDFSGCTEYRVSRKEYDGIKYVSDHWPITAVLKFQDDV